MVGYILLKTSHNNNGCSFLDYLVQCNSFLKNTKPNMIAPFPCSNMHLNKYIFEMHYMLTVLIQSNMCIIDLYRMLTTHLEKSWELPTVTSATLPDWTHRGVFMTTKDVKTNYATFGSYLVLRQCSATNPSMNGSLGSRVQSLWSILTFPDCSYFLLEYVHDQIELELQGHGLPGL